MVLLLGGLIIANGIYYEAYSLKNTIKPGMVSWKKYN
mgnify:CR=1 FL=1